MSGAVVDEAPKRTASGREITNAELAELESKEGVVEELTVAETEARKLGTFGRSGSSKQMIRQGSSSARR